MQPLDGQDKGPLSPAGRAEVGQKSTAARDFCFVLYITAESETGGYSSYCVPWWRRSLGRGLNVGLVTSPAPGATPATDEGNRECVRLCCPGTVGGRMVQAFGAVFSGRRCFTRAIMLV